MLKTKKEQGIVAAEKTVSIIGDVVAVFSWLGITSSSILVFCKTNYWYIIPAGVFAVLLVCVYLGKKNRIAIIKYVMNMLAYNMKYSFEEWTAEYEYHSNTKMSFRTTYLVKAIQAGVEHVRVRFNWSGATDNNPIKPEPIREDGYYSNDLKLVDREYGYNHYNLCSSKAINKGDKPVKLGVKLENLEDAAKIASPHLLTSISVTTKKLNMIVILPYDIHPENYYCLEYLHATDDCHWRDLSNECNLELKNGKWYLSVTVDKPVFGGKYILRWNPTLYK